MSAVVPTPATTPEQPIAIPAKPAVTPEPIAIPAKPAAAPATDGYFIRKALVMFEDAILKKNVDVASPTSILQAIYRILSSMDKDGTHVTHQKELLIAVVTKICAGIDGVPGTSDDLLPPATVAMLTAVINNDLINDIVNFAKPIARKCFALLCIQPKVVV